MGSSAKTGKKIFRGSPEHFLDKNAIWDRTPPHLHINCSLHVWGRLQGSQIFKRNSIISIRSKVMAFLVILLSPHGPCCPRVIPVVPTSSPSCPRHPCRPHSPQKVPMWSPWSVVSPRRPRRLHVVPTSSPSSPRHPRHPRCPQKVPMWSPWSVVSTCCPRCLHVVPVIPMSFPSSPHHLEGHHIIPKPPDTHSTHPLPPWGVGGPESVKMQ